MMEHTEQDQADPTQRGRDEDSSGSESRRKLISIVVPVFNEEENVEIFHAEVTKLLDGLAHRYEYEIVFTDNHSTDRTFELLSDIAARDPKVRVLRFSKNFGYQKSILTGYLNARGDCAIQMDVDLQDPPDMILQFLSKWEEGSKIVYGIRVSRKESWFINVIRKMFYRTINLLSEDDLPLDAGDFRLVDRLVIDELAKINDDQPYLRGTFATIGFEQQGIRYSREERKRGTSKFSFRALMALALDGILSHSTVPLRMATYIGLFVTLATFLGVVVAVVFKLAFGAEWPRGFATTTILILIGISLNALFLGIIGEYLGRIYKQVKRKPVTIIERSINVEDPVREGEARHRR